MTITSGEEGRIGFVRARASYAFGNRPVRSPPVVAQQLIAMKGGSQDPVGPVRAAAKKYLISGIRKAGFDGRQGEGFRVPAGVRKPLMQEPAGHGPWLWGFRFAADVGDYATASGRRQDGCAVEASLRRRAVLSALHPARRDPVGGVSHHRRARFRCRRRSTCGLKLDHAMPGHGAFSRFVADACGGPRGCLQRSNVSMMIMRPPQQGHGGR